MISWAIRAAVLCSLAAAAAAAEPPPIAAYGRLPDVSKVAMAPDGSVFAAMVGGDGDRQLQLRALPGLAVQAVIPSGDAKIRDLDWAGPDHLLLTLSTTARAAGLVGQREEWSQLADYNVKKRKLTKLLQGIPDAMNVVIGSPVLLAGSETAIAIEGITAPDNVTVSTVFRINLDTGFTKQVDVGVLGTSDWVIADDGKGVARADYRQGSGSWALMLRPTGTTIWKRSQTVAAPIDRPQLLGYGVDTGSVLVGRLDGEEWVVQQVSLQDGSWSTPAIDLTSDVILRDRASRLVIGSVRSGMGGYAYRFLAPADQKLWDALVRAFPGEIVSLVDWSVDRMTVIVEVEGTINGDAYYLVDRRTRKAEWIANRYAGIAPEAVAERRVLHYRAADGMDIPAWLTLPRGRPARSLPLVVLPHGGPASSDGPGFDWWSQALASRGYAVLQPQFRGSEGLGNAHLAAGYGQWGRKMQTDLSDGVRQLAKDGIVDSKRVCIVGASYGGYAALAGVALESGVYRCAVAVAGVSDLRRMLRAESDGYYGSRNSTVRYWRRFMGAASNDDASIDAWSPALHAAAVTVPVLLIHGKDDTVVRFDQSLAMRDALAKAGRPVELVTLTAEDHWLSRGPTRIQMLEATVKFLETHNPPDPAGSAVAAK